MKMHFLGGFEKQYFQDGKKNFFLVTKSRCLGEKKGVQFAWAKHKSQPKLVLNVALSSTLRAIECLIGWFSPKPRLLGPDMMIFFTAIARHT